MRRNSSPSCTPSRLFCQEDEDAFLVSSGRNVEEVLKALQELYGYGGAKPELNGIALSLAAGEIVS